MNDDCSKNENVCSLNVLCHFVFSHRLLNSHILKASDLADKFVRKGNTRNVCEIQTGKLHSTGFAVAWRCNLTLEYDLPRESPEKNPRVEPRESFLVRLRAGATVSLGFLLIAATHRRESNIYTYI